MRVYGLTGGIGSGKSEAAQRFAEWGCSILDADAIGHALLEPGGAAVDPVVAAFGSDILTHGIIDRRKLGARVFSDRTALRELNAIIHPEIYREIMTRCAALQAQGCEIAIIDAALLAEDGLKPPWLAGLIVVVSSASIRVARLMRHRGMAREDAEQRIASQAPAERKTAIADWVIDNDGSLEQLRVQVDEVAKELRQHGTATR